MPLRIKHILSGANIMTSTVMPAYFNRLPIAIERGQGSWLWDTEGNQYLDALSGIAVCSLGHAHPAVTTTICEQANKVIHTSNTYQIPWQEKLATALTRVSGMDQAFFANSGAEANEAAIKITRAFAHKKGINNPIVITMNNSFHGRTMATLSASGSERLKQGFEPILEKFIHVPLNDLPALENVINQYKDNLIAIMLEPIQGDGGIQVASSEYLKTVRDLCDQHDWLMILDEVQTGMCRTGKWFAYQHDQIRPDVMTLAKALANGIPIGACLASGKACNLFGPGKHGSTFGGNPFACAVGCTVVQTMEQENIAENAATVGDYLQKGLKENLSTNKHVTAIRGKGLMIGVELDTPCRDILLTGLKHRLLFNVVSDKVIRILPPLIISRQEADEIIMRLKATIEDFFNKA